MGGKGRLAWNSLVSPCYVSHRAPKRDRVTECYGECAMESVQRRVCRAECAEESVQRSVCVEGRTCPGRYSSGRSCTRSSMAST